MWDSMAYRHKPGISGCHVLISEILWKEMFIELAKKLSNV